MEKVTNENSKEAKKLIKSIANELREKSILNIWGDFFQQICNPHSLSI
jgi:hypothetical protein